MNSNHPLFSILKQGISHTTSRAGYRRIINDGYVIPNRGQFGDTYPQSSNSCCRQLKSISLFDFATPREEDIFDDIVRSNWIIFFRKFRPTVCLVFPEELLRGKLIRYKEATERVGQYPFIWPVEVCYPDAISINQVIKTILVYWDAKLRYKEYHQSTIAESEVDRFIEQALVT